MSQNSSVETSLQNASASGVFSIAAEEAGGEGGPAGRKMDGMEATEDLSYRLVVSNNSEGRKGACESSMTGGNMGQRLVHGYLQVWIYTRPYSGHHLVGLSRRNRSVGPALPQMDSPGSPEQLRWCGRGQKTIDRCIWSVQQERKVARNQSRSAQRSPIQRSVGSLWCPRIETNCPRRSIQKLRSSTV